MENSYNSSLSCFPAPLWLQTDGWDRFPGLVHGFSGRLQDQEAALSALGVHGLTLHTLKQVHGDEIVVINRRNPWDKRPEADGMITAEAGALLGVATADCVPVLIVEPEKGLIAALHAGWRGTLKGICPRAVETLTAGWGVSPQRLWVALGPAIGGCCYEVGREVGEALSQRWQTDDPAAWRPVGEKGFVDLRTINLAQLEQAGIPRMQISLVGPCTFCGSAAFASYRREGLEAGRQISVIGWRKLKADS
jgi:hypothetical protein